MPNARDLTTVTELATALGVDAGTATLPRIITAASRAIASYVGYDLHQQTITETVNPWLGYHYLQLKAGALQSITSITVDGTVLSSTTYRIDSAKRGRIVLDSAIAIPSRGTSVGDISPTVLAQMNDGRISVVAVCGYSTPGQNALTPITYPSVTLPEDIQQACIETAVAMYRRLGRDGDISSTTLGAGSLSYREKHAIPVTARQLLAPYRNRGGW
jgi:hypothetical protein